MRAREMMAVAAISATVAGAVGFGISQASQPEPATAAKSGNAVAKELKKANKTLVKIQRAIGEDYVGSQTLTSYARSTVGELEDIERATRATCRAVGGSYTC